MKKIIFLLAGFLLVILFAFRQKDMAKPSTTDVAKADSICFVRDVLPIFQSTCTRSTCHDAGSHKDGVITDSYDNIMKSKRGRAIMPGEPLRSSIYRHINATDEKERMPPAPEHALTPEQNKIIFDWITQGALNSDCTIPCDTLNVSYATGIQPILAQYCYHCHGADDGGAFALTTYKQVVNKAKKGVLAGALKHAEGFKPMPSDAVTLPDCKLAAIRNWVKGGYKK
jgi:hypothetical protein